MDIDKHKKKTQTLVAQLYTISKISNKLSQINVKSSMIMIFEEEGGILLIEN